MIKIEKDPMDLLEELLGTVHELQDDWNSLGWRFGDIPGTNQRVCTLNNYTECKAEGGDLTFYIEKRSRPIPSPEGTEAGFPLEDYGKYGWSEHLILVEVYSCGSGPHGIPWWLDLLQDSLADKEFEIKMTLEEFAEELQALCKRESRCGYWEPWYPDSPSSCWVWLDKPFGEKYRMIRDSMSEEERQARQEELDKRWEEVKDREGVEREGYVVKDVSDEKLEDYLKGYLRREREQAMKEFQE